VLKDSGYSLPWIETIREIEGQVEKARAALRQAWAWRRSALEQSQPYPDVQAEWQRALEAFKEQVAVLNKRIRDYNLEVPHQRFQRPALNVEREVQALTTG
jgi:uncharacterized protein YukE